jgi:hypothetical protein
MTVRDGKNSFYRTLNLDEESKAILRWYRKTKKQLLDGKVKEEKNK